MYVCMSTCYSAPSRFLFRGAPDYSADTESEFHAEANEQLRVQDLPRVPTRRLEVDSKPQPSGCKAPNISLHHRAPQYCRTQARIKGVLRVSSVKCDTLVQTIISNQTIVSSQPITGQHLYHVTMMTS